MTRTVLAGSGAILGFIGCALLFAPRVFLATSEVLIEHDPGLMSEVTAPTGMLIATGTLMIVGAIKLRFANMALICGAVVYGSYGISRLVSMQLHGVPSDSLVIVTIVELCWAGLLVALRFARPSVTSRNMPDAYVDKVIV